MPARPVTRRPDGWPAWHDQALAGLLLVAIALFAAFPQLDLSVSARLYEPGAGFVHRDDPVVQALYRFTPWIGRGLMLGVFVYWLLCRLRPAWVNTAWQHGAALSLVAALLGPGLLIEGVLKPYWQRPRPVQVVTFGGSHAYQPPFRFCGDCRSHHSFVSSHAAAGFALANLGLAAGARWRRRWLGIGLLTGAVVGAGRLAQGGHFVSDIVFAFFAVWLTGQLVLWLSSRRRR